MRVEPRGHEHELGLEALEDGEDDALEGALHLFLLNRGLLITPFHNMLLVSPHTTVDDGRRVARALDEFIAAVRA